MNENRLTERMRAAVGGEPPLGFDPDELTDRAGRQQRRRRAVLGAAAATLVLTASAVTVGASTDSGGHRAGGPTSVAPAPDCPPPMATLAPTVITRHLPGVSPDTRDLRCTKVDVQYLLPDTDGRVWLYREQNRDDPVNDFFAGNETAYHLTGETGVPGATVRTYAEPPNQAGRWLRAAVWIGVDNLVVWAEVSGRGTPTTTEEQLIALVSDPQLRT